MFKSWDGWKRAGGILALMGGMMAQGASASDCANPTYVLEGTHFGKNQGAGLSTSGICSSPDLPGDAWFQYVAPEDGILNLAVRGETGRHVISVWEGCPQRGGGDLVCRDDGRAELGTIAGAMVQAGQEYLIRVSSLSDQADSFELDIDILPHGEVYADGGRAVGPDVVYQGINSVARFGPVNNIYAYILDSHTCNNGNQNLRWGGSWAGSPSLAMNVYRHKDGRLMQIGMGWCKQACCAAAGNGCAFSCNNVGGSMLGSGCLDIYSSSWNAIQSALAPRNILNPFTGAHQLAPSGGGNAIDRRCQVSAADLDAAQNPNSFYFVEGVYVASDDAAANALNNASYRRVTVSNFNMTVTGPMFTEVPAITAWRGIDPTVVDGIVDVPNEGRFHTAHKVTDLGGGNYRYDYAIFNLNSDRAGGSFSVPVPAGTTVSNIGFHDVNYHSGEPHDNTDWVVSTDNGAITWRAPQTFQQNPNSNFLGWGTMYNFWFEANSAPAEGQVTLGLFKPHTPQSVQFNANVPSTGLLLGDLNCDGVLTVADIGPFVIALTDPAGYASQFPACNILSADMNNDGVVTVADIAGFVAAMTS